MRKPAVLLTALAVAAGALLAVPAPASATTAGVAFSGDDLPTWQTNGTVWGMVASGSKVVVGGTFSQLRPPTGASGAVRNQTALAVLDAETGAPDACQFPVALSGGTPTIRSVVVSPDGATVYIGGNFSSVGGVNVARVAAIDPAACRVLPFRTSSVSSFVYGMAATPDTLYLAGAFRTVAGQPRERFAAVDARTGALRPWAPAADLTGRAVAVSPDGTRVAIGGDFDVVNGRGSHALAIVDAATGASVRDYPVGFFPQTSLNKTLWSDSTTLYGGNEGTGGGVFDGRFAIDWATLDQKWRDNCLGATQAVLEYQGTLYSASHAHDCASNRSYQDGSRKYFLAQNAADATILGWFPTANDGTGEGIGPRAMTIGTGRTTAKKFLWYGGEFTRINGRAQQSLTRFGPDDIGAPPVPAPTAEALTPNAVQVRFRTVVDPDDARLTYSVYRNNATTPIWTGTADSQWWTRPQVTVVDTAVTPGTSYSYRVTASDGVNTSALSAAASARAVDKAVDYPTQVVQDGASLYWRLGETGGTWAQDKSGATTAGLNGLYQDGYSLGAPGAIAGSSDTAATFDGVSGYAWSDQLRPGPTTYSVETWIRTTTTSGGKIVGFGNGRPRTDTGAVQPSGSYDRHVYMDNAGRLTFGVYTGQTNTARTAASYNDGAWHHVVATQGPSGMRLYVDGKRVAQNAASSAQAYDGSWRIGGDNIDGWPDQPSSRFFAGQIDDTAVYPSVLTPQQVAQHYSLAGGTVVVPTAPADAYGARVYQDGAELYWRLDESTGATVTDASSSGENPGTARSNVSRGGDPAIRTGRSSGFDGTWDGAVASQTPTGSPAQYSQEAWFRTTSDRGGKIIGFEDADYGNGGNYDKQVYMTDRGSLLFGVWVGYVPGIESAGGYNDGRWHHLVTTQGPAGMAMYLDGALVGSNDVTGNQSFTGYWRVGGGNIGGWPASPPSWEFRGDIDEVAIYGAPLSADTVAAHYALGSGTAPDTTAPSAPVGTTASASADRVTVGWSASSDDTGVTAYEVHRGASAGFTPDGGTLAGTTAATAFEESVAPGTWYYRVVAVDAAGNRSGASVAASATVAPPPDTTAPTAPGTPASSVSGSTVPLTWPASTDAVGVTGYRVHRGTVADFPADASTRIAEVGGTAASDAGRPAGTWYYRVVAVDAAGNASAASASVAATVAAAPVPPTVVSVVAAEDSRVTRIQPTSNFGADTQLSSTGDASSSPARSFLRFDIPAAPAGTTLTGATLALRTSTDPTAGSVDVQTLALVEGDWTENTVTWNTQPTAVGPALGTLTGATAVNTAYRAELDAAQLAPRAGSSVALRLSAAGTDNLRLWSSEAASASYRPTLVLTYSR